ncbi:MAG: ComEA family DNA-binding protein [Candidatus Faecousia sp.]|nr:ComEA family DNA-binding protein [Candidatus Faecousia sp.]
MKKPQFGALVFVTALFSAFLLGFFLGRQSGAVQIQINSVVSGQPSTSPPETTQPDRTQAGFPININTASAEELTSLPGIGDVLAGRIVSYREQYGSFLSTEELMDVTGISEKTYERIREYVTVGG